MDKLIIGLLILFSKCFYGSLSVSTLPARGGEKNNSEIFNVESDVIEFLFSNLTLIKLQGVFNLPVVRRGTHLNSCASLSCYVCDGVTKSDSKFYFKQSRVKTSSIIFAEEQELAFCSIYSYHDKKNNFPTNFEVHLSNVTCETCQDSTNVIIGNVSVMHIVMEDDRSLIELPVIELETSLYSVKQELITKVKVLPVKVLRYGSIKTVSIVRVRTFDGTAAANVDYITNNSIIYFRENQTVNYLYIKIVQDNSRTKSDQLNFTVKLVTEDLLNAQLGQKTTCVVKITRTINSQVFPAPPIVVSLPLINSNDSLNSDKSPSHPLVCVTSCNPYYFDYSNTKIYCERNQINTSSVSYSWEVGLPTSNNKLFTDDFQMLIRNSVFGRVDQKILDPMFFRAGYLVRCVARYFSEGLTTSPSSRSEPVRIRNEGICGSTLSHVSILSPFTATLTYIDENDAHHPNRLKILIEIPHEDNMIPLISTIPLNNLIALLSETEPSLRKNHYCSNLILPGESQTVPLESQFINSANMPEENSEPFQLNLLNPNTTLLYKHLDLPRCLWKFAAFFTMEDLINLCGGTVSNLEEIIVRQATTVRVSLHVAMVYASENLWTSKEHYTEMEFSFYYNSLWKPTIFNMESEVDAYIYIKNIKLTSDGKLVINLQTKPHFAGCFLLQHQTKVDVRSRFIFSKFLDLNFNLNLLWTAKFSENPIQIWQAVSAYSLNDYSGLYILELIPCLYATNEENPNKNLTLNCITLKPKRFEIPVVYEQSTRPLPVVFSLKTYLQLTNSKSRFLSGFNHDGSSLEDLHTDSIYWFRKGDRVYGKVFWNPGQNLGLSYTLQIEAVYLCADISSKLYLNDHQGYDNGCFQSKMKHRILLLHRDFYEVEDDDDRYSLIRAGAKFIEEEFSAQHRESSVDGFIFKVDGLYDFGLTYRWFIHVLYVIGPSIHLRQRRSLNGPENHITHNGTILQLLPLASQNKSNSDEKDIYSPVSRTLIILNVIMIVIIILLFIIFVKIRLLTNFKFFKVTIFNLQKCYRWNRKSKLKYSDYTECSRYSVTSYTSSACSVTIKSRKSTFYSTIPFEETSEV